MLVERSLTSSFEDRESALISRRYGVPGFFILLLYWNWWFSILETVFSGNLSSCLKGVKPLVLNDEDQWDGYGANAREIGLISIWFVAHRSILRSWGDISVLLVLLQCFWGLSGVQSSKSRLLMSLISKTQLLWTQWRGIGPHLAERGKSHGFSRVAEGTSGIFSSYGREVHSKLEFVQWSQDTCLGMRDNSGM